MSTSVSNRKDDDQPEREWFAGLDFSGRLDPAGAVFALLIAIAGTIGVMVVTDAVLRVLAG